MSKTLKNLGFVVVVLFLTAAFYWLIFIDKETKKESLEYTMDLLGNKLLAMIPENADKKPVETLYRDFMKQTEEKKISPQQVEYVAANILNLSNNEEFITAEQAKAILDYSTSSPFRIERFPEKHDEEKCSYKKEYCSEEKHKCDEKCSDEVHVYPEECSDEKWEELSKKMAEVYKFNDDMQETIKKHAKKINIENERLRYRIDKDLKVIMDDELKNRLEMKELKNMAKEIKKFEQERMIEWREDFHEELKESMEHLKEELESLKELKELENLEALEDLHELKGLKHLEALKSLEALKNLEHLECIPVPDPDSIRAIVERSLKEAGIE